MPLHRLTAVTIGVPNVAETPSYYTEFGLTPQQDGWFGSREGGRQLRIVRSLMLALRNRTRSAVVSGASPRARAAMATQSRTAAIRPASARRPA